jgi:voltage-gated potassium channel
MVAERTAARLEAYENKTSLLMVLLALVYLLVFAVQVLVVPLPPGTEAALDLVGFTVWATFAIDLAIRTYLAPRRMTFLTSHPIDVLAVAVPAFRFLRVLRVVTAGQWLVQRGSRLAISQTALAIVLSVGFLAVVGALAVLDAERGAPGSNIENFGDAMWWAFVTMSTVGYGDTFPVTAIGQLVAVGMMLVGIGLLGVVSGTLASGLVARLQGEQEDDLQLILEKMDGLEAQVTTLTKALQAAESNGNIGR